MASGAFPGIVFPSEQFRSAIISTMVMGLPEAVEERVTFRWRDKKEYSRQDNRKKPYNWTATPTDEETHPDVQIPAAVEFSQNSRVSAETTIGSFNTPRVTVTILDTHYPEVDTADLIILHDGIYVIEYWGPPLGLFDVSIYQCYGVAYDEA